MSKAEERALQAYPSTSHYWNGEPDRNASAREFFKQGYHQAEKDLKLSWEDVRDICSIQYIVLNEYNDYNEPSSNILYQEVLKRFKAQKGE